MPTTAQADDTTALLPPFLTVLSSSTPISLPNDTLYGAITHFLSTLPLDQLDELVKAVVASPTLWSGVEAIQNIQDAFRLSVQAKLTSLSKDTERAWFGFGNDRRKGRIARSWLRRVVHSLPLQSQMDGTVSRKRENYILVGLLLGLDDGQAGGTGDVEWGVERVRLEERVIIALHHVLDGQAPQSRLVTNPDDELLLLCHAIPHISTDRLQVLDLEALHRQIQTAIFADLEDAKDEKVSLLSGALATVFPLLCTTSSSQYAQGAILDFLRSIQVRAKQRERAIRAGPSQFPGQTDTAQPSHNLPSAFFIPGQAILTTLLSGQHPSETASEIALELLLSLAAIVSSAPDSTITSTHEGYHHVLYGSMDVLASTGGTQAVKRLFSELTSTNDGKGGRRNISKARAELVLVMGEQLLNIVDGRTAVEVLLPLCERHLLRPSHQASFEAAHAFFLAFITKSGDTIKTSKSNTQEDFLREIIPSYARLLLRQFLDDDITSTQFLSAFPQLCSVASLLPLASISHTDTSNPSTSYQATNSILNQCLDLLSPSSYTNHNNSQSKTHPHSPTVTRTEAQKQTIRLTRIAIAPHLPINQFPIYLDDLVEMILGTPQGSEHRRECVTATFRMVGELGEDRKVVGVRWWEGVRGRLVSASRAAGIGDGGGVRAKL